MHDAASERGMQRRRALECELSVSATRIRCRRSISCLVQDLRYAGPKVRMPHTNLWAELLGRLMRAYRANKVRLGDLRFPTPELRYPQHVFEFVQVEVS
jgi:hypothetical protein